MKILTKSISIISLNLLLVISANSAAATSSTVHDDKYAKEAEGVIEKAKALKGYEVKFDYQNYPKEREIAYQYFLNRFPESIQQDYSFKKNEIGIDLFDIDNDNNNEIFAYLQNSPYCGNAGCPFEILKITKLGKVLPYNWSDPKKIEKNYLNISEDIIVLKSQNLGMYDLLFNSENIWQWQGDYYMRVKNTN